MDAKGLGISKDMADLLVVLAEHDVEFLICGGHAVAFHGYVRMTMDLDILINPNPANAAKLITALEEFGFGGLGISADVFAEEGVAVSLGVQPNQIDLLTSVSSQSTREVFAGADWGRLEGQNVRIIGLKELIRAKEEAGRSKDKLDVEELHRCADTRKTGSEGEEANH